MTLAGETRTFFAWLQQVIKALARADWRDTWTVIIATVGARVANLLAFFMPLKVILLVGTDGIPRYFQAFITQETRTQWIIGLSIATVAFYLLSVTLESLAKRRAMIGSGKVLRESNEIAVIKNQDSAAESYYYKFCNAYASFLFVVVLLVAGLLLHPWLFLFVGGVLAAQFVASTVAVGRLDNPDKNELANYILEKTSNFLTAVSSTDFLLVFGFLLTTFLLFDGINILVAILSLLIARQLFTSLSGFASEGIKLSQDREKINALIFRDHQHQRQESSENRRFRALFEKPQRIPRVASLLDAPPERVSHRWVDSGLTGAAAFSVESSEGAQDEPQRLSELVYFPSQAHVAENEDFLFRHVEPQALKRPSVLHGYEVEGFIGRVYDCDVTRTLSSSAWKKARFEILAHHWSYAPPRRLIEAYTASRPLMHERLTPALVESVEIALDDPDEHRLYGAFVEALPQIRSMLASMPLFVYNPRLSRATVFETNDDVVAWYWGQWSLEPVGVGLVVDEERLAWLADALPRVAEQRAELAESECETLQLPATLEAMERHIQRGRLKMALTQMSEALSLLEAIDRPVSRPQLVSAAR